VEQQEMQKLFEENTGAAVSLLYHLCEMVKYTLDSMNVRMLLQTLSLEPSAGVFYKAFLHQVFQRITDACELTPQEAISFYQQFSVLNYTMQHNPTLANLIRHNFTEEFKVDYRIGHMTSGHCRFVELWPNYKTNNFRLFIFQFPIYEMKQDIGEVA
jgi:hypothetical protein